MRVCVEQKQAYFDFVNEILESDFDHHKSRCIASLSNDDKILGVVMADRFSSFGCELNIASITPRFLTRELILVTFHYIFNTCGKMRISTLASSDNVRSLKFTAKMGFIAEARLRNFYGEHDAIVFRMLRDECPWIGK